MTFKPSSFFPRKGGGRHPDRSDRGAQASPHGSRMRQRFRTLSLSLSLSLSLPLSLPLSAGPVETFLDTSGRHGDARRALDAFPEPLPAADIEACLAFLAERFDHTEDELLIVRQNDLADRLLQRPAATVETARVLLAVIADESADVLWREYCLQKLPLAYEQEVSGPGLRAEIVAALRRHSADPAISFSATSLLGLYRIREAAEIPDDELVERAAAILDGRRYANANKVTALQIAVLLGDADALARARRIAADSSANLQLRVSAIASLGQRGTAADLDLILPLTEHPDYRTRHAARRAVERLQADEGTAAR